MEARTARYENREQMAREVARMGDEGWRVQRVTSLPEGEVEVEFLRRGATPYLEGSDSDHASR